MSNLLICSAKHCMRVVVAPLFQPTFSSVVRNATGQVSYCHAEKPSAVCSTCLDHLLRGNPSP